MADISLVLTVDAKTGNATLKQVGDNLDQVDAKAKKAQGGLAGVSGTLSSLSRNVLGAVSVMGALKLAFDSLKAQDEAMKAANSLNLALANQGNLLPGVSARLLEFNDALQQTTAFEADAITAAQGTLASFGMNEEAIKRTTTAALDFSAATGKDLPNVMELLGKAYAGNTAALARYGIVIDESVPKSQRFEAAIGQIEQRFHGFAAAEASSFSGGLAQARNALGDAQEALGKFLGELLGADKPFGAVVSAGKVMADFFGKTMILVLSEARAQFAEFWAGVIHMAADNARTFISNFETVFNLMGQGENVKKAWAEVGEMEAFATGLEKSAAAIREHGNQAAIAAGKTLAFTNNTRGSGQAAAEAAADFKRASEYIVDGLDLYGSGYLERRSFDEVVAWATDAGRKAAAAALAPVGEISLQTRKEIGTVIDATKGYWTGSAEVAEQELRNRVGPALEDTRGWTLDLADVVDYLGSSFEAFGVRAESVLGRVIGGLQAALGAAGTFLKAFASRDLAGMIGGGLSFLGGAARSGPVGGAVSGAAFGGLTAATILPMIGSTLGPIGTIAGAGIGALLGGVFGKLFGGKKKEQIVPPTWEETFAKAERAVDQFGLQAARGIKDLLGKPGDRRPEAQAFVDKQLGRATGAMGAIGGLEINSEASARAQATIFTTTFWAVVGEQGLVAGVDALSAPFGALKEKLAAGGFDVDALLGGVGGLFDAVEGPARSALEAADGLNQALQGIALAGYLTQDSFNAFGTSAQDAFQQAVDGGLDSNQALLAIAPLLQNIEEASRTYGMTIDENTQALLDQAHAAGIAFPTDPMERAAAALEKLVRLLGGDIPEAANTAANAINGLGNVTPGGGGVPSYHQPGEGYAGGFNSPSMPWGPLPGGGTPIVVHPREQVSVIPAGRRNPSTSGGGNVSLSFPVVGGGPGFDKTTFQRVLAEEIRRKNVPELIDRIVVEVRARMKTS